VKENTRKMTNLLSKNLISPILLAVAVWIASVNPAGANPASTANPLVATGTTESDAAQIEQAKEATEIKPGDWAYQTLQSLSSKYNCGNIPAGNKILSREEFATSLNGCVQSIEQLVARRPRKVIKKRRIPAAIVAPPVAPEVVAPPVEPTQVIPPAPVEAQEEAVNQQDLDRLKGLIQSFSVELQGVDSRVQAVDDKLTALKAQSFSTTTKLNGEAIIGISGFNTGRGLAPGTSSTILTDRVRLNFDTSFTGKDLLRTRLQSRNTPNFSGGVFGTNMTRLGYDGNSENATSVSLLKYNFPLSPETKIIAAVVGAEFNDEFYNFNPVLESSGGGSISRFGRFNPIYRLSNDGATIAIDHKFSPELGLAVAYGIPNTGSANTANNIATNNGLFNGSNVFFGQLRFTPVQDLNLGVAYARSYHTNGANLSGGTGSSTADTPFGTAPTSANHYSFLASYKVSPGFVLSGWAGFTEANREVAGPTGGGNASASNYAISLAFPDFGQKGNALAFILGIPPKLNSRSVPGATATAAPITTTGNPDTSYHIEALYKIKLSDNLAITPGILLITNPEHNSANPTEYVGTIRTTFKF
jgi:Carbohydrate-selective porin, OprB family